MKIRDRFHAVMNYRPCDRVPYFEEGLRSEVLAAWRRQGMPDTPADRLFPADPREEIAPDLDPRPKLKKWPDSRTGLKKFAGHFDPDDPRRLPPGWRTHAASRSRADRLRMLRVHRGFFLAMGVYGWQRFTTVVQQLVEQPALVHRAMAIQGEFAAGLAENMLQDTPVDAAIFSEPIGGNHGPLMSPRMYEAMVLETYRPLLAVLKRHNVGTIIFRTYANARILIPSILKFGFNCLWACEVNMAAMDYRSLRREFGRDLRLIGGIDLDTLHQDKAAIRREIETRVPPLIADGGYIPLADGRVREDVPYENYVVYRQTLDRIIRG